MFLFFVSCSRAFRGDVVLFTDWCSVFTLPDRAVYITDNAIWLLSRGERESMFQVDKMGGL